MGKKKSKKKKKKDLLPVKAAEPGLTQNNLYVIDPATYRGGLTAPIKEPEAMDIHHHTHSDSPRGRKKWIHYFWEFLMLFLAVTLGFFVENEREHMIERKRARQYAVFLHNDLVNDTPNLKEGIEFMTLGIKKLDTLVSVLRSEDPVNAAKKIYDLSTYAYSNPIFSATTSTIEQLKNSGSLRYFHGPEFILNFSKYDNEINFLKTQETRNAYLSEEMRKFLPSFLDLKAVTVPTFTDTSRFTLVASNFKGPLKFYKQDPAQFAEYANLCTLKQLDWQIRVKRQVRALNSIRMLIANLEKKFNLEPDKFVNRH